MSAGHQLVIVALAYKKRALPLYEALPDSGGGVKYVTPMVAVSHVQDAPAVWTIHGRNHVCTPRKVNA